MKHFKLSEFDCKGSPGTGSNMDLVFLLMIDKAREIAGTPFLINSGFRTKAYNDKLIKLGYKASPNSSHLKGKAADIHVNSVTVIKVIRACVEAGFKRIGIARTFIHVDNDNEKVNPAVWLYNGVDDQLKKYALRLIEQQ
jgi:zinc D-Ala-D-Ala carboxypeptidase